MASHDHQNNAQGSSSHHVTPLRVYFRVWVALLVFTVITVASSYIDFGGPNNILLALLIATIKAVLVSLYFMGLKYDGAENKVTFFGTFVFLAIFVSLTGADLFYRTDPVSKAKVDSSELVQSAESVDVNAIRLPSPELLEKGKTIFAQQCATCHGMEGKGNGPAAAALTPVPRDFTSGVWKYGGTPAGVFKTITAGVPGTPMPSFASLRAEERFALAHYVRHFDPHAPSPDADTPAVLESLGIGAAPKPHLPLAIAMEKMAEAQGPAAPQPAGPAYATTGESGGKRIYGQMCMSCHGVHGEGAAAKTAGVHLPIHLATKPLASYAVTSSQGEFTRVLTETNTLGLHGYGALSNAQWSELYEYVRGLR